MKKRLLGVIVVAFVIFAGLLAINEMTTTNDPLVETEQFYAGEE